jgi:hypothetical protein
MTVILYLWIGYDTNVISFYTVSCISPLYLTFLKLAKWLAEKCRKSLCTPTYTNSSILVYIFCYYFYVLLMHSMDHIKFETL